MSTRAVIYLSDLHIGKRGKKELECTRLVFKWITSNLPREPVLITGDLTDSGTKPHFLKMRKLLDDLAKTSPGLTVPGNHDYARYGDVFEDYARDNWAAILGSPLGWLQTTDHWRDLDYEPKNELGLGVWRDGPFVCFGIDSADPQDKKFFAKGLITERQANVLAKTLRNIKGKTRIAFLHHHLFKAGKWHDSTGCHENPINAVKGNCELLLFGHKHRSGIWSQTKGVRFTACSNKNVNCVDKGLFLAISRIVIEKPGTADVSFGERCEGRSP